METNVPLAEAKFRIGTAEIASRPGFCRVAGSGRRDLPLSASDGSASASTKPRLHNLAVYSRRHERVD